MTTLTFWRRVISVEIAGLIITEPKIEIDVRRKVGGEPPTGSVLIHNLAETTQQQIKERNQPIVVNAGYSGRTAAVFNGLTYKVERDRQNLSGLTRITLTGNAQTEDAPMTIQSWRGTSLVAIVTRYVGDLGLSIASLGPLEDEPIDFWYAAEPSAAGLTRLLTAYGYSWYEENGLVKFNLVGTAGPDIIELSSANGLIDRPTETDAGARARSFMLPQIQLGTQIQLESEALAGLWKVVALEHKGTNWLPGDFYTDMELRAL